MIVMMGFTKEFIAIVTTMGNVMNSSGDHLWKSEDNRSSKLWKS
jgi:hypothetical protein